MILDEFDWDESELFEIVMISKESRLSYNSEKHSTLFNIFLMEILSEKSSFEKEDNLILQSLIKYKLNHRHKM